MATILIATRNEHKVGEIRKILGATFDFLTLKNFPPAPQVMEDASTFAGNATKKAVELAMWLAADHSKTQNTKIDFILADDSGLEVDALHGAPGVHSARLAALDENKNSTDADNNAKLLRLLKDVPLEKRAARFRCVIALVHHCPQKIQSAELFDGVCEGRIIFTPRGANGFGYDPLFVPDGYEHTFAELDEPVKNQLSHRGKALAKLRAALHP